MSFLARLGRLLKKPPGYVWERLLSELKHELDRFTQPAFGRRFPMEGLLSELGCATVSEAWEVLLGHSHPFNLHSVASDKYESESGDSVARLRAMAERARDHQVDLLGSGLVNLGSRIDWSRDYKTGDRWPRGYFRGIDYINRGRPSDVKTVWELSRMQWLMPSAQLYVLTGDEEYATTVRSVIESWIDDNPYAMSVNWGVTMEPAMRLIVWIWFFHACGRSKSWQDDDFRAKFLRSLYLHAIFTERFIERADINGNHFTADAAALVVAGGFFRTGAQATRWLRGGLLDLEAEMPRQVGPDGVDFEASVAYHRLVAELFLVAAAFARSAGHEVSDGYKQRLNAMGWFTAAYSRVDGTSPLLGDADDARTLPFGGEAVIDHRYLPGLIGLFTGDMELVRSVAAPRTEAWWWYGPPAAALVRAAGGDDSRDLRSVAFPESGYFVLRDRRVHTFIDCAPVGLAGRGGHGHNDVLSFDLVIDGVTVVSDAGSYVYTADFVERNAFRSGRVHNTPMIDGQEQNRFHGPHMLWTLEYDAHPEVIECQLGGPIEIVVATHSGYRRIPGSPRPIRRFELHRDAGAVVVHDRFEGQLDGKQIAIPLQLGPEVRVDGVDAQNGRVLLRSRDRRFSITWAGSGTWALDVGTGWVSRSYGTRTGAPRLEWRATGGGDLRVEIASLPDVA